MTEKNVLKLSINDEGKQVETFLEKLEVSKLSFYPNNPRVGSSLLNCQEVITNDSIHRLMLEKKGEAVRTLYQKIKKAHNVNEPLFVYENQVIEGNTRLCVLRELYKDTGDSFWKTVNCRVIKEKLSDKELNYLIYHLQLAEKKRDWEPFEEACYFYKMNKEQGRSIVEIKEITDLGEAKIKDYITTYEEMVKRCISAENFSLIYETIKVNEVKEEIKQNKNSKILDVVIKNFEDGNIKNAREPRKLKDILICEKAKNAFLYENQSIEEFRFNN